ncbi:calcium-translocating P-type ATPase, SERCA-type [Peribacillus sp. NPDC097675]|uniref:calcium-translocating P-type ATPase, SERCA-type n=1 Tax=Peribacillus sp. NPDC097675 TaxID=3390618 RepID=UPI003CFD8CAA
MEFKEMNKQEMEKALQTNVNEGLKEKVVQDRLNKQGFNELKAAEKQSAILLFFAQFKDFMVIVLLAATLISGILGEYIDAIAIIAIVFLNGVLGFFQERKAEKSLDALKEMTAPQVQVLRSGQWLKIPSREVVVGDILKFASGDRIGADLRIVDHSSLEIEESALTGESIPAVKCSDPLMGEAEGIGDQENMAFMGTMVTRGNGIGIVVATGMNTAMGKIADLLQTAETKETPLQRRLEQLGKILIITALILTGVVVLTGVLQGHDLYTMFLAGVSLAVAAIPEGLPAIVTVALSLGVQRMIKQKAIVRKLPAVETLGCATVICSDKTGTLTQNKMTVTKIWSGGRTWDVSGTGYHPIGEFSSGGVTVAPKNEKALLQMMTFGLLCNKAEVNERGNEYVLDGDPTEGAMVIAAMKAGLTREHLSNQFTIVKEFPFDSERKMMSVVVKDDKENHFVVVKGAPDVLIAQCDTILVDGRTDQLNREHNERVQQEMNELASSALRMIAVGYKPLSKGTILFHETEAERNLTFMGLQGMIDPPRPEVKQAVKECRDAGIKTVMITGDHVTTAKAIAKDLGILRGKDLVLEGRQLSTMEVDELEGIVEGVSVFARVSPEHKLKIVKALQNKGHVVAMTGDGVNDAPAIKSADIGISMGITGTDVAKEASSLILVDDNFATIKSAIKEGRNIYENIRKFIRYLLASNVGEILVMFFAMLCALPLPLIPIQILFVNLVTDGLPAMALGLDAPEEDVMKRNPRSANEGVFGRGLGWKIISRGFLIGISTLIAFYVVYRANPDNLPYAQTIAFATLVLAQLIHVFDCRSEKSIFSRNPFGNLYLVGAVLSSLLLMLAVMYVQPLQEIFHTVPISGRDWLLVVGMASIPTFLLAGTFLARKAK